MDPLKMPQQQETKLHFLDYWRIIRIRRTVILAVFALVVVTATLVTYILPESYSSTARIKIERDQSDISPITDRPVLGGYDPFFLLTEFEVIKSEIVLGKVIQDLDLNREWGKKYAGNEPLKTSETMALLKSKMDLRQVRNTSLIDVQVFSEKPEEAARIANALAEAYQAHRLEERMRLTRGGIEALEKRWEEQERKVREAETNVDRLRQQLQISDVLASESVPTPLMSADSLRKLEGAKMENKVVLVGEVTLLERLKSLKDKLGPEALAQVIPRASQDPLLTDLLQQLNLAEQRLVTVIKDYGPLNPEALKANKWVEDLHNEVNQARTNDIAKAEQSRPYFDAKHNLEELQRFRQILTMKIAAENIDAALPKTAMVEIIDKARPGLRPVRPDKFWNIALGVVIGLVVGVGLAFFIEYLDTSVKTIDDVERSLQAPVLGVIPQNVGLLVDEGAESPHAEAYRVLRTNLLFSRKNDKLNTIAVVSAGAGEGKSTTVFNLAAVFAQAGQRTLMVDSDLRRPTLHKMLGVTNNIGLTNYLLKQNTLEQVIQRTSVPSLDFMASGKLPSSSLGILSSAQMKALVGELKQRYDFIFFDSPPIMGVSDASILASEVDMSLQIIQYRRYPQPMNIRAKQLIEKVGGNLIGIVLNNINMSQDESYYYYSGYYHDYYSKNEETADAASG